MTLFHQAEVEVPPAGPEHPVSLLELASTARREHAAVYVAQAAALDHAIACGHALLAAKDQVPHGEWKHWLRQNTQIPLTTAGPYMRLAFYEDQLPTEERLSKTDAMKYLRALPGINGKLTRQQTARLKPEALELRGAGFSRREIAAILDVSYDAIRGWVAGPRVETPEQAALRAEREASKVARKNQRRSVIRLGPQQVTEAEDSIAGAAFLISEACRVLRDQVRRESSPEALSALTHVLTRLAMLEQDCLDAAELHQELPESEAA